MSVIATAISEVLIIEPKVFGDQRGFFLEAFNADRYATQGVLGPFVQDNLSRSARGVLRGLHMRNPRTQGKLVSVLRGKRHGGRQSSLIRSLLPDSCGSAHASTKRLADKTAAPQFQPRYWLGTQWMRAVIHALKRTVRSHL